MAYYLLSLWAFRLAYFQHQSKFATIHLVTPVPRFRRARPRVRGGQASRGRQSEWLPASLLNLGESVTAMFIFDDIDSEKSAEENFVRSKRAVSIGRLSAHLVYELANPLDGVLRYTKLLLNQMDEDDPKRDYTEQILDGLTRIMGMVRGMSDFIWKNATVFSLVDIPKSIGRILSTFNTHILTQNIEVETKFDENIPRILNIDVEYIFASIIENAIQAMPDGGKLSISAQMLSPKLFEARFSDTGHGIADEVQQEIFKPFFTTRPSGQGNGLGLSISREIIKSYNGAIDVESQPGRSTTFLVRLPVDDSGLTKAPESQNCNSFREKI